MSLDEYDRKRNFSRTAEPRGKSAHQAGAAPIFVVQLHHARARHFDFRLQVGGALASWAVPKGPSLRPGERRLAVQVEDHPLDYAGFEGIIPEGNYGAGDVRVVDHGTWQPEGDAARAIKKGKLDFTLHGTHLKGHWTLVRTGSGGKRAQWLLMKRSDDQARDTDLDTLVHAAAPATSVRASAKARRRTAAPEPKTAAAAPKKARGTAATSRWAQRALKLAGAKPAGKGAPPLQLATLSEKAPAGDDWLHEVKWDGYRLLASRSGDTLRLESRNGTDWTGRFPDLEKVLLSLPVHSLRLDGELVVLDERGRSDFARLQRSLQGTDPAPVCCIAFDLLQLEGVDLTGVAQLERKRLLEAVLAKKPSPLLAYSQHIVGHGPEVFAASQRQGLEGILSKRVDAPYVDGRSRHWLKVKHHDGTEAVVVGYTAPQRSRTGLGSLMLALREGRGWRYVGRVGTGMDEATLKDLRRRLEAMKQDAPVLELPAHVPLSSRAITWVRPTLVVEVAHRGWGKEGLLRQASFLRERLDKSGGADDAAPAKARSARVAAKPGKASGKGKAAEPAKSRLTSPDRVVFKSPRLTKRDVADYYATVAPWLLPGIVGRPLSVLRAPDGVPGETFFQKHGGPGFGDAVHAIDVREKSGRRQPYLAIDDADGLLALVQMNALEFHPWGAHSGHLEEPERIVFDLDPGPGVGWKAILAAARAVRDQLAELGLESFPLLSGGKGVHVIVPLARGHDWDHAKSFAEAIARLLALREPGAYVATASKQRRQGRIFIDWLRNGRGATSIAAWSLRARPGAAVAMPVRWQDLSRLTGADHFRLPAARRRAATLKAHPWGDYSALDQHLPVPP
ncbi:DNA ligase D [Arenimonas sp. MALMAid1274]|uniref:DNA ligase D n=1 Tax=Arenimonas sp. MALMAid1274 TaxID=3411630 RepID=UPI003BA109F0